MRRTRRFTMNLSEQEADMLRALAEDAGVDQADVLRVDVRKQFEARFGRAATTTDGLAHAPKPML